MRDPARIKPFLNKLEKYWLEHPDLRLGQVISNTKFFCKTKTELFYVEDDLLEEGFDNA